MILFLALSLLFVAPDRALDQSIKKRDTTATIARINALAKDQGARAIHDIADAVAEVESVPEGEWYPIDRHRIFVSAVKALATFADNSSATEVRKVVEKHKQWPARILALEVSLQSSSIDSFQLALIGIKDKAPQVVSVASRILGHSQNVLALEPLISAMTRWEQSSTTEKAVRGGRQELQKRSGDRAWLSCRDSLERLTGISLHQAMSYKNWISAHRDEIDPTKVDLSKPTKKVTGTGLFGLDITGRNIVFVVDISGSMMATDPPTAEEMDRISRSTGVGGSVNEKIEQLMENRRRIKRARIELRRAIESLGDSKNFTVVSYSSTVQPWNDVLVAATKDHRKSAVQFVNSLKAQGITVTDEALSVALSDPTVDTIYLITDGAPTHIGSQGDQMPPDSRQLMKSILQETKARNHLRGVRIFTLGFIGAEEQFLNQLAIQNHGRYVRIR